MGTERNLIDLYKKSLDERTEWIFKIESTLAMIATTTFAVIVSLSNPAKDSLYSKVLLSISIGLNGLCILFSGISIYENKVMSNKAISIALEYIDIYRHDKIPNGQKRLISTIQRKKFFVICEKCSYISFILFIIILAIYAILKIFTV